MQDKMMRMMLNKKKQGKELSDPEKKAKLEALMGMKNLALSHMNNKLNNLKKVTVASDSPEGLKAGLHKAEDLADQSDDDHAAGLEDSDMLGQMNKYSEGGDVDESGHREGPVAKMPPEFETDERSEHEENEEMGEGDGDERPDHQGDPIPKYDAGTFDAGNPDAAMDPDMQSDEDQMPESIDQMVEESPDDPEQLEELIQKLQEKQDSLKHS